MTKFIKPSTDPTPRYVLNFEEFIDLLKGAILGPIDKAIKDKYPQIDTTNIELLLKEIRDLLPDVKYKGIKESIDLLLTENNINGLQKIEGRLMDIPPIIKKTEEVFLFDKDIYITGFHFNQTGWKTQDSYCLMTKKNNLIQDVYTKEVGDHKMFNTFFLVKANTPIIFTLNNKSGNSRQTMVDLEYLEKLEPPIPPEPPNPPHEPTIGDIKHDWDIAVVLKWESNIATDVDLHAFMDSTHVWYSNLQENNLYLDFDCLTHIGNEKTEILSVQGNTDKVLNIYVNHYSGSDLTEPATIQIYKNGVAPTIIKEYQITLLPSDYDYLVGVCSINLGTLNINDLANKKKFR